MPSGKPLFNLTAARLSPGEPVVPAHQAFQLVLDLHGTTQLAGGFEFRRIGAVLEEQEGVDGIDPRAPELPGREAISKKRFDGDNGDRSAREDQVYRLGRREPGG